MAVDTKDVKPVQYRRLIGQRYIVGRLLRYGLALTVVIILVVIAGSLAVKNSLLTKQLVQSQSGIYRTESEMVSGGKRFIDYLFSLNAASIEHDQYRAIEMILDADKKQEHIRYLKQHDLIRTVKTRGVRSEIDWRRADVKIINNDKQSFTVSYKTYLVVNYEQATPIHLILTLLPVKKSDTNTDGVGVVSWRDLAKEPFVEP